MSLGNEVSTMKLGLENIRNLLAALGNPQNNYLKVQVAGTNGKGSVCAFLDSICNSARIKTGTFTSPHLVSITERVRINGADISEKDFARHATMVRGTAENLLAKGELDYRPTFFEHVTALALIAFAGAEVELAILETGLGGRLDATTAVNAEIAAITRIDYDHQNYLGETIEEIAGEKAAIIHGRSRVVVGEQIPQTMDVIQAACRRHGVKPLMAEDIVVATSGLSDGGAHSLPVVFPPLGPMSIILGLSGKHQVANAKVAILLAKILRAYFPITREEIIKGLQNARHPGRLEYQGRYLFDGAHNIGGAKALAEYIREFETRTITLLFGVMQGKNVSEMLEILAAFAQRIIITEPSNSRSFSYEELLEQLPVDMSKVTTFATDNVTSAIDIANKVTLDDGIILITGSLYLVGEAKKILNN